MFRESAHTLGIVKHGMNIIQKATNHVHPLQVPVLTDDQPLYSIAKKYSGPGLLIMVKESL